MRVDKNFSRQYKWCASIEFGEETHKMYHMKVSEQMQSLESMGKDQDWEEGCVLVMLRINISRTCHNFEPSWDKERHGLKN